jgi:hypothetical protein
MRGVRVSVHHGNQATGSTVFSRSKDFSDWMISREYFLKYSQTYRAFDLDGDSDNDGLNSQVAEDFCCPARPCQERDLQKYRKFWLIAQFEQIIIVLGQCLRRRMLHPHLRAVIVVPKWRTTSWLNLVRNFRLVDELAWDGACPTNDGIEGRRQDVRPTRWTTQVFVDDTDRVRFMARNIHIPPKTYWTQSTSLITDGR